MYIADEGITFQLEPGPRKDDEGRSILYAIPDPRVRCSMKLMSHEAVLRGLVTHGEMERVFNAFFELAGLLLSRGYRLETPIGSFAPKLRLMGEFTDPQQVKYNDVEYAGVDFRPSKDFVKACSRNPFRFKKKETSVGNSQMHDTEAMEEALRQSLAEGFTNVRRFMYFSHLKRDSARSYLNSLCEGDNPRLQKRTVGRSKIYMPVTTNTPAK